MFWDQDCQKLSNLLWIPKTSVKHQQVERNKFKCNNKNISFNYLSDKVKIHPNIKFLDIPAKENLDKKNKLENSLFNKELKRFEKENNNPNRKLSDENILENILIL